MVTYAELREERLRKETAGFIKLPRGVRRGPDGVEWCGLRLEGGRTLQGVGVASQADGSSYSTIPSPSLVEQVSS
jgi:hypothetical protein